MMRKIAFLCFCLIFAISEVFASFTFSFGPHEPYFNPDTLDPYGFKGSEIKVFYVTESNHLGNNMMIEDSTKQVTDPDYYRIIDYRDFNDKFRLMLNLRTGFGLSILRMGWPEYFMLDFALQGSLNTVFASTGGADNLGFDGSFFVGGEMRIMDMISIHAGLRHFSGHTGDEIVNDAMKRLGYTNWTPVSYTRDNMIEIGIGYDGCKYFDIWASFLMPQPGMWWSPFISQPDWIHTTGSNPQYTAERNPEQWAVRGAYGNGYGAYILQFDANVRYPFLDKYEVFASGEVKLHQDGMTNHTLSPDDDTDKWETEFSAAVGFSFINAVENLDLTIELGYHNGRFPLLNFFWKRAEYFSFSLTVK